MAGFRLCVGREEFVEAFRERALTDASWTAPCSTPQEAVVAALDVFSSWRRDMNVLPDSVEVWPMEADLGGEELTVIGWEIRAEGEPYEDAYDNQ